MGPETARWGGGLPLEGVVAENFVPALESLSSLGFEERNLGCPGNFAGMSWTPGGVQKLRAKKTSCAFFVPYKHYRPEKFLSELFPAILDRIITGKYAKRINLIVIRAHYRKHLAVHRSHDTRTEIP